MSKVFERRPERVFAMFWDGSKDSFERIKAWMPSFLLPDQGPYCEYWETYDEPPSKSTFKVAEHNIRGPQVRQVDEWKYRTIDFYAWGDDQQADVDSWIVFYGSEQDITDEYEVQRGKIMRDDEFRRVFMEVVSGGE